MALGDGIARNKGNKGFAFQKGYKAAAEDLLKILPEEFGTSDEVVIQMHDIRKIEKEITKKY